MPIVESAHDVYAYAYKTEQALEVMGRQLPLSVKDVPLVGTSGNIREGLMTYRTRHVSVYQF